MMRELAPYSLSPLVLFPNSPFPSIACNKINTEKSSENVMGYVSQNGMWTWIVRGCTLEVFSTFSGERCSSWCFGSVVKNSSATITAVTEFCSSDHCGPHLVVAVNWGNVGALLCIFDVKISKVVKAVEIPNKITFLEVISTHGITNKDGPSLGRELEFMFGIVAIGTEGGHVVFLDLCLDEENYSNELSPSQAMFITRQTHNIPGRREDAFAHNQHICLPLNDDSCHYEYFEYKNHANSCLSAFPSEDIAVTSLKYISKLATLAVGFNFGGFQLWNIQHLVLEYSCNLELDQQPVIRFAFQEPENDPKNFCYLWVVRGHCRGASTRPNSSSTASLYSLTYSKKKWLDSCGFLYEELQSCFQRLEYFLSSDPLNPAMHKDHTVSRLIACYTIPQADILRRPDQDDALQEEEWNNNHDLSICILAWEAWQGTSDISSCFLVLFDINQWYQSQMPSFVGNVADLCPYLGVFSLSKVVDSTAPEPLLDVCLLSHSLTKFKCLTVADQFFYPSSLAFTVCCVSVKGVIQTSYLGVQRQILSEMATYGPSCLVDPKDLYSCCVIVGLLTHSPEVVSSKALTQALQREALLSVALQNNLSDFLASCVQDWSTGEYRYCDCTLKFLLDWAWKRVTYIKTSMDKLFIPLFNCSGEVLIRSTLQLLHSYDSQLRYLTDLLVMFQFNSGPMTEHGRKELTQRAEVISLINTYLQVILWLYNCCLLPEHLEGDEYGENEVAYPASYLSRGYSEKRASFQKLHGSIGQTDILLIDGIVSQMGQGLSHHWEKSGGNGLYPPPSLYAALGGYLIEGQALIDKHCLILYLLLDMAAFLSDRQSHLAEKLVTFSATFNINPSKVKLTQGFWLLDHQDFEEAIAVLLNPIINPNDIQQWQHARVLKAFLYHGEHQKALKYSKVFHIPHSAEEVKLHLSILLGNQMIAEALHYQRQFSDQSDKEDLLTHLFLGCQQTHLLDSLLQQPLMPSENKALIDFLNSSPEPQCRELLVMYHLLNGRPMDAIHINDSVGSFAMSDKQGRAACRNALIQGYLNVLPEEQKILAQEIKNDQSMFHTNKDRDRPQPLSTIVTNKNLKLVSYADLLQAVVSRIAETYEDLQNNPETPSSRLSRKAVSPFVGMLLSTPSASKKKRVSTDVVFPTPVPKRPSRQLYDHQELVSPSKRSKYMDVSPRRPGESERRRGQKHLSGDVISLLHTPPVCRKPSSVHNKDTIPKHSITPQSILKVRHFLRRSTSPIVLEAPHRTTSDFNNEEDMMEDENEDEELDVVNPEDDLVTLKDDESSKQLRFQVPKRSTIGERFLQETYHASPRRPLHDFSRSTKSSPLLTDHLHSPAQDMVVEDEDITLNFSVQHRKTLYAHQNNDLSTLQGMSAQGDTQLDKALQSKVEEPVKNKDNKSPDVPLEAEYTISQDKAHSLQGSDDEEKQTLEIPVDFDVQQNSEELETPQRPDNLVDEDGKTNVTEPPDIEGGAMDVQEVVIESLEPYSDIKEIEDTYKTNVQEQITSTEATSPVESNFLQVPQETMNEHDTAAESLEKNQPEEIISLDETIPPVIDSSLLAGVIYVDDSPPKLRPVTPEIPPVESQVDSPILQIPPVTSTSVIKGGSEEVEMETSESKPHVRSRTRSQSKSPKISPSAQRTAQTTPPKSPSRRSKSKSKEQDVTTNVETTFTQVIPYEANKSEPEGPTVESKETKQPLTSTSTKKPKLPSASKGMKEKPSALKKKATPKKLQFTFSEPSISEESEGLPSLGSPQTPVPSFVFSPPLTRSRTRQKKSDDLSGSYIATTVVHDKTPDPLLADVPPQLQSLEEKETSVLETSVKSRKKAKGTKRNQKQTPITPARSVINLLTPIAATTEGTTKSQSLRSKGLSSSKHGMVLRKSRLRGRKSVTLL